MTESEILHPKSECWQDNSRELFALDSSSVGLISEQERPSLYSLSLSDSVCSESTIDLDAVDHSETFHSANDTRTKLESSPLENNFMSSNTYDSVGENAQLKETSATEPANETNKPVSNKFRKSMSLHDVSNILPLQLTLKSFNTVSSETIHSHSLSSTTKSKDSGFQRSVSCLSLTSGKRKYDHVQSKVKAYITNIKESEALRKKNKLVQKTEVINEPTSTVDEIDTVLNSDELLVKIQELKHELHEKAQYIEIQQRNYNSLLLKLAAAKNTIDSLRVQQLSLDYSYVNESWNCSNRPTSSFDNFNFDLFEQEMKRKSKATDPNKNMITESSLFKDSTSVKEQVSSSLETPNTSLTQHFRPRKHSTPDKIELGKSLSPVSKMFSSSLRLDKNYIPLANPKKEDNRSSSFSQSTKSFRNTNTNLECNLHCCRKSKVSSSDRLSCKSKQTVSKLNNVCDQKQHSTHIDLPNVDPFDKVKKWQASLPSISLLGTHSSSDCEMYEACSPSKKSESEINCLLSHELVTKCRISDMDVDPLEKSSFNVVQNLIGEALKCNERVPQSTVDDGYKSSKHMLKNKKQTNLPSVSNNNVPIEKPPFSIETEECEVIGKPLNCEAQTQSSLGNKHLVHNSLFKCQRTNFPAPIAVRDSSVSENESHSYLPKSSSFTHTVDKVLKGNSSNNSDDSSSISSSVLGSNAPLSATSPSKKTKRRSLSNESDISNKVAKLTKSRTTQTNFILREPKLNVAVPVTNIPRVKNETSQKNNTDYETWFKYRNSKTSVNIYAKTESSQRKAWNARNKVNFSVCKDFHFKKSSTLKEWIEDVQQIVETGYSLTETMLKRSNY